MVERRRGIMGSSGGSMPKKPKPIKVPQRGLGVAQLEKIRLEEQHKNAATASAAGAGVGAVASSVSSSAALLFPHSQQPPPLPFFPSAEADPLIRSSIPMGSAGPHGTSGSGPARSATAQGYLPILDSEAIGKKFRHPGFTSNDASSLGWLSSGLLHTRLRQQLQQQQTSLVNNNTLSPSSSGASLQMEPPSNQSHSSNYPMPAPWSDEERVVGMKRPYPFCLDAMLPPSHNTLPCKMPRLGGSFGKQDEPLPIYGNDAVKNTNMTFRESTSGSSSHQVDWKSSHYHLDRSVKENGCPSDGAFLTLGSTTPTPSISKCKQSSGFYHHYPELNFQPSQASVEDAILENGNSGRLPFYSFLPMATNSEETNSIDRRGEALDELDLNLKL